jgi:hypothetical protein
MMLFAAWLIFFGHPLLATTDLTTVKPVALMASNVCRTIERHPSSAERVCKNSIAWVCSQKQAKYDDDVMSTQKPTSKHSIFAT